MLKIGIIGAGAAGFFSAIHAAEGGAKVTILEKTSKVLAKVKISGGGRCNVTHAAFENPQLIKNYPRGEKFLKKVFGHFSVKDTVDWFESRGVKLKVEQDGRMFPVSDDSQSIIDALQQAARALQVETIFNFPVIEIRKVGDGFQVISEKKTLEFDRLIVCIGGFPKIQGFDFLQKLGHTIIPPVPSLFTFNTPNEPIKKLMGISVPDAFVRLEGTKLAYRGPLLITHWGVSGPAVLKLSAFGAQWLFDQDYHANAHIRWVHDLSEEETLDKLNRFKHEHPKKKIMGNPLFGIPTRLWEHLAEKSDIESQFLWYEIPKKQLNKLVQNLFCYIVAIEGKTGFKEEFVTAGGVDLNEVHPDTMESKIVKNLFFSGEVVNIDGITGGFNFQAAWSTGYLAGKSSKINA
ncbi:NAD(P)/FAD-dependent oxidoreductase [Rhodonellum sp.]|uniref:NAD(P)/FAD-dependent oxidoreductase n=1 Tax=Rhodonellum sp. TaxID=2231180 RepID=UPI00271ADB49|nr:NAD(P)/FAD-dependent oxidoreductase [Rhodonellum sp.]MDO9551708.1 NAD(P)/FAD-dependent oxidoreductase [Rhodonellum sp.]